MKTKSIFTALILIASLYSCKKETINQCPIIVRKEVIKLDDNNVNAYYLVLSNQTKIQVTTYVFDASLAGNEYCDSEKLSGGVPKDLRH